MRTGPDDVAGRGLFDTRASALQAYAQQQDAQPVSRQPATGERGLLSSQTFARPQYAQQTYRQPVVSSASSGRGLLDPQPGGRGLFEALSSAPQQAYAQQRLQPPTVLQYRAPPAAAPLSSADAAYAAAAPVSYAAAAPYRPA